MHNQPVIGDIAIGTASLIFLAVIGSCSLCSGLKENEVQPDGETDQDGEDGEEKGSGSEEVEVKEDDILHDEETQGKGKKGKKK